MKYFDITLTLSSSIPIWPGDPKFQSEKILSFEKGDNVNVTKIMMGVHTGTHVDAPLHFLREGSSVDAIHIESLIGMCRIIEINDTTLITAGDLKAFSIGKCTRLLIKTKNSNLWMNAGGNFEKNFVSISKDAAEYLAETEVRLVGIDYLSIEGFNADISHPVHNILLQNGIIILEGLDLSIVPPGEYELICLPMKIENAEGAPARAVLRQYEK